MAVCHPETHVKTMIFKIQVPTGHTDPEVEVAEVTEVEALALEALVSEVDIIDLDKIQIQ